MEDAETVVQEKSTTLEGQPVDEEKDEASNSRDKNGPSEDPSTSRPPPPDIEPRGNRPKQPGIITNKNLSLPQESLPPLDENTLKECEECHMEFLKSYLYRNFRVDICDDCRDPKGTHELITRTDAKNKYLLKDCDLDLRKPTLCYILKKNPYQSRGDMRLYLKFQIEERALEVHGSEEQLEEELERREERRTVKKQKTYDKKMKSLTMQVRSSLYKRDLSGHKHEYGDPVCINEDKDLYRRICKTCNHKWDYEEM